MSDQLQFDRATAEFMESFYRSGDILRRRASVLDLLEAKRGDTVLDVGSGPGFYVAAIAELVGPHGSVVGVDPSEAMLETSRTRCADLSQVAYLPGSATDLPVDDASIDRVLSVQVLEYVEDIDAALAELHRVLRPGGRLVIWDVDWSTVSWFSRDPERMRRVLRAWDEHLADPSLPQTLGSRLVAAGFADVEVHPHVFVNTGVAADNYSTGLLRFISDFVPGRGGCTKDDVDAWRSEQFGLGDDGEFFFAFVQFGFVATRPPDAS